MNASGGFWGIAISTVCLLMIGSAWEALAARRRRAKAQATARLPPATTAALPQPSHPAPRSSRTHNAKTAWKVLALAGVLVLAACAGVYLGKTAAILIALPLALVLFPTKPEDVYRPPEQRAKPQAAEPPPCAPRSQPSPPPPPEPPVVYARVLASSPPPAAPVSFFESLERPVQQQPVPKTREELLAELEFEKGKAATLQLLMAKYGHLDAPQISEALADPNSAISQWASTTAPSLRDALYSPDPARIDLALCAWKERAGIPHPDPRIGTN